MAHTTPLEPATRLKTNVRRKQPFFAPAKNITPVAQRKCAECETEEKVQRKTSGEDQTAPSIVGDTINSGNGKALDVNTKMFMENRFGYDFSNVKIHTQGLSAKSAESINAKAYTSGSNIVFNEGKYIPVSTEGKKLPAHELTHVVQQGTGSTAHHIQRAEIDDDPALCSGVQDIAGILNTHINGVLSSVAGIADGGQRVQAVYDALGAGSPFSHIEEWCEALPATQQHRVPVEQSRYSTTFYGSRTGSGLFPAWLRGERAMGTLINIGGLCIGSDKLGHFFQQGRDYFYIADTLGMGDQYATGFGEWLEGTMPADPAVQAWINQMDEQSWPGFARLMMGYPFWQGVYGLATTGVYSRADLEANRNGMEFYRRVYASPSTTFSARSYINGQWNERQNPSCFGPDMARLVAAHDPEFTRTYRETMTRMLEEHPYSVSAYHGMGVFERLIVPYVERYRCH